MGGSQAQEESLARSSGLYPCIAQMKEMYEFGRQGRSGLYLDHMIYSPDVPIFKDDAGNLLSGFYTLSIITSAAVNAGAVAQNEAHNVNKIDAIMLARMEKILSVALLHEHKTIILGAWGCGVFRNDARVVAKLFGKHLLAGGRFHNRFDSVRFAVLDRTKRKETFEAFDKVFT